MNTKEVATITPDILFKKSMLDIDIARDFFHAHLPKRLLADIDLDTLNAASTEQILATHRRYTADITYKVKFKPSIVPDGNLILLVEHQSKHNKNITLRMMELSTAITHRALKAEPNQRKKRACLPPVATILFSTAQTPYSYSMEYNDYFIKRAHWFTPNARSLVWDLALLSYDDLQTHGKAALFQYVMKRSEHQSIQVFTTSFTDFIKKWSTLPGNSSTWAAVGDHQGNRIEFLR